jgi:hypothetical protein
MFGRNGDDNASKKMGNRPKARTGLKVNPCNLIYTIIKICCLVIDAVVQLLVTVL